VTSLPLGAEGVLDSSLPQRIGSPPYARAGDSPGALVLALLWIIIIVRRTRDR
jgi:apolipoprotein N-acyltransferase